jgi:hypothetical protein
MSHEKRCMCERGKVGEGGEKGSMECCHLQNRGRGAPHVQSVHHMHNICIQIWLDCCVLLTILENLLISGDAHQDHAGRL